MPEILLSVITSSYSFHSLNAQFLVYKMLPFYPTKCYLSLIHFIFISDKNIRLYNKYTSITQI